MFIRDNNHYITNHYLFSDMITLDTILTVLVIISFILSVYTSLRLILTKDSYEVEQKMTKNILWIIVITLLTIIYFLTR